MNRSDAPARPWMRVLRLGLWAALIAAGLALWSASSLWTDPGRAGRALLVNFLYFVPLAAGFFVWSAIHTLSRAKWADRLETILIKGAPFALPSLLAIGGLWMLKCPLAGPGTDAWLSPAFVYGRDAALLAMFWAVAWFYAMRRRKGRGHRTAGPLSVIYVAVFSLLGFDLSMSPAAPWKSTIYGLSFAASGLYIAAAAWTLVSTVNQSASKKQLHDLGKIVVGMSLIAAYLMFSQVLTIWYGNLPAETSFLVERFGPASRRTFSLAVIALVYIGPPVLLLGARLKQHRLYLGMVATLVLFGMWLERFWLVVPSIGAQSVIGMPEIGMACAFIGALGMVFDRVSPSFRGFSAETSAKERLQRLEWPEKPERSGP